MNSDGNFQHSLALRDSEARPQEWASSTPHSGARPLPPAEAGFPGAVPVATSRRTASSFGRQAWCYGLAAGLLTTAVTTGTLWKNAPPVKKLTPVYGGLRCDEVRQFAPRYFERLLSEDRSQQIADHLQQCAECQTRWRAQKERTRPPYFVLHAPAMPTTPVPAPAVPIPRLDDSTLIAKLD